MVRTIEKYPLITLSILVLIMLLPNLNVMNITIMEARNFITAREMVNDGNWILTTLNGEPRYQKPPLPTWIAAFFGYFSGFKSVFFLRLPSVLMILLTGITTYLLSLKLLGNKLHSFINALIVVTSFYVIGITIEAPWDIYNHGFMLLAIYFLWLVFEKELKLIHFILAGIFMGFSFLSKGPVSFYALLLPFLIAYGVIFKFNRKKLLNLVLVLIIAMIIGSWWFLYVKMTDPETFLKITEKETTNWSNYNVRPFYYYWSFFTQSGLWTVPAFIGLFYPYLKDKISNLKAYQFSIIWVLISLVLLSVIPEKKSRYLMPLLLPLAINTGFYIEYLIREFKNSKSYWEIIPVYFNFGLIALIGILFPVITLALFKDDLDGFWPIFIFASLALLITSIFIIIYLKQKEIKKVFYLSILFFVLVLVTVMPLSKAFFKNDDYLSISALNSSTKDIPIYCYGSLSPEIIWDYGEKIVPIDGYSIDTIEFGLLTKFNTLNEVQAKFTDYRIDYKSTFDLNPMPEGSKKYKDRLKTDYYILTKK